MFLHIGVFTGGSCRCGIYPEQKSDVGLFPIPFKQTTVENANGSAAVNVEQSAMFSNAVCYMAAVKAADEGDSGKMVVLQRLSDDPYQCGTEVKDVHKIANDEKVVPREWVTEDGSYVTDDFVSYVRPLIQGDVSPVMVDGIPRHLYRKN